MRSRGFKFKIIILVPLTHILKIITWVLEEALEEALEEVLEEAFEEASAIPGTV